jgi:FkbH-like protein
MSIETIHQLRAALRQLGFNDHLRYLKLAEQAGPSGSPLRIAILRSYTVEPLEPVLKLRLLLEGHQPTFWFGGYNQYVQEILATRSGLSTFKPHLALLLVRLEEAVPDFIDQFASKLPAEWEERLIAHAASLASLAERVVSDLSAQVVIQNAALWRPYFGVFDAQRSGGQRHLVHRFNEVLADEIQRLRGVFVWDFERLALARGMDALSDAKSWYVSRNPFKQSAYPVIAEDLFRTVQSVLGRTTKCIVLDLDNTLWGGIVGEEGIEGIRLGHTYPGNCYREFQKELLKLYNRGILLAVNSKNNEEDAMRVLTDHPDMVLRREHFAGVRINWQDKASNLRELVRELNIGMDSVVYVDDNPAECDLIRRECPECEVVLVPDKPYLVPATVEHLPRIENARFTEEDRQKGEMYRAQAARREFEQRHTNVADFLRSLQIEVEVAPATAFSVPRIAQLTQKTNQWNMTTRRYTDAEIQFAVSDPSQLILSIASTDRFGDDGIVGVCILKFRPRECEVDTFLLSCRVIGRGIEHLMMAYVAEVARTRGVDHLVAEFLPTHKNKLAEGFYESVGFQKADTTTWRARLGEVAFPFPEHIKLVGAKA